MVGGLSWGCVGPSWGYVGLEGNVGPSWGYVGPSWGYVGPSWSYVGPSWGYVGPSWGLCCPILRPMLAHVDPSRAQDPKHRKTWERAQNTVKRRGFWRGGVGRRQGRRPLSPTERREGLRQCHGQAPGRINGLPPPAADPRLRGLARLRMVRSIAL